MLGRGWGWCRDEAGAGPGMGLGPRLGSGGGEAWRRWRGRQGRQGLHCRSRLLGTIRRRDPLERRSRYAKRPNTPSLRRRDPLERRSRYAKRPIKTSARAAKPLREEARHPFHTPNISARAAKPLREETRNPFPTPKRSARAAKPLHDLPFSSFAYRYVKDWSCRSAVTFFHAAVTATRVRGCDRRALQRTRRGCDRRRRAGRRGASRRSGGPCSGPGGGDRRRRAGRRFGHLPHSSDVVLFLDVCAPRAAQGVGPSLGPSPHFPEAGRGRERPHQSRQRRDVQPGVDGVAPCNKPRTATPLPDQ